MKKEITSKSSKRIALYHLMKLHNRAVKASTEIQLETVEQSKASQEEFIHYSTQTITKDEFPTAIYRLAVCYEKSYGVAKDIGMSYLLYAKTIEQFDRKIQEPSTIFNMSFLNVYSVTESKRRMERISKTEEVTSLKKRIRDRFD